MATVAWIPENIPLVSRSGLFISRVVEFPGKTKFRSDLHSALSQSLVPKFLSLVVYLITNASTSESQGNSYNAPGKARSGIMGFARSATRAVNVREYILVRGRVQVNLLCSGIFVRWISHCFVY